LAKSLKIKIPDFRDRCASVRDRIPERKKERRKEMLNYAAVKTSKLARLNDP